MFVKMMRKMKALNLSIHTGFLYASNQAFGFDVHGTEITLLLVASTANSSALMWTHASPNLSEHYLTTINDIKLNNHLPSFAVAVSSHNMSIWFAYNPGL